MGIYNNKSVGSSFGTSTRTRNMHLRKNGPLNNETVGKTGPQGRKYWGLY